MRPVTRHILLGTLFPLALAGCTTGAKIDPACSDPATLAVVQPNSNATLKVVPSTTGVTMYPGQTVTVGVSVVSSNNQTGTATISANKNVAGLSATPVTAAIGSTAQVTLTSTPALAASCFYGVEGAVTALVPLQFTAQTSSGTVASTPINLSVVLENQDYVPTSTDLPVMSITTNDSAAIDSEDDDVDGSVTITDASNSSNNYSGTMEIKGHGTSSWLYMPKKPYRMKLDSKAKILGMSKAKNWILLANYDDKTMLRDYMAFYFSKLLNAQWTPSSAFAEVYVNGQYEGVYQVTEKVEVDSNRLDIGEMDDTDISGDDLTGGYLGEIDTKLDATFTFHSAYAQLPIDLDDPDPPVDVQANYFRQAVNTAEAHLFSNTYTDSTTGWPAYYDQDAMVNWFLVEELMGNQDSQDGSSMYFNKPRSDQKIYMGPVWDFDISSGNDNYGAIKDPTIPWVRSGSRWYIQLFKDPNFQAAVKAKWATLRPQLNDLDSYIDTQTATLSLGAQNNYSRWPTLYAKVWPNVVAEGSYTGEVAYFKSWLKQRIAYMDANYLD